MSRISDFQRMEAVDEDGNRLGRVFDLKTSHEEPGQPPRIEGFLVGRGGLARRLGIRRGSPRLVRIDEVVEMGEGKIVVRPGDAPGHPG